MIPENDTNGKGKHGFKSVPTYIEIAQEAGEFRLPILTSLCTHNSLSSFSFGFPSFNFLVLYNCSVTRVNFTVPSARETDVQHGHAPMELAEQK